MPMQKKPRNEMSHNLKSLKKRAEANPNFKGMKVVEVPTEEKMSAVVLDFVAPYKKHAASKAAFEKLMALALVAWNASLMEKAERQALIATSRETILKSGGAETAEDFDQLVTVLIRRKERYFAANKRMILDFRISETKHEFGVAIISTLTPSQSKNITVGESDPMAEPKPTGLRRWFSRRNTKI